MTSEQAPRVWALLGPHRGDNNQVIALAEALGLPFEEKKLSYNGWRRIPPSLLGATFRSVESHARAQIERQPPDLTISTGLRSVPVVRELRRRGVVPAFAENRRQPVLHPGDPLLHAAPMSHGSGLYMMAYIMRRGVNVVPESGGFEPQVQPSRTREERQDPKVSGQAALRSDSSTIP